MDRKEVVELKLINDQFTKQVFVEFSRGRGQRHRVFSTINTPFGLNETIDSLEYIVSRLKMELNNES